jgi:hypothetical protein
MAAPSSSAVSPTSVTSQSSPTTAVSPAPSASPAPPISTASPASAAPAQALAEIDQSAPPTPTAGESRYGGIPPRAPARSENDDEDDDEFIDDSPPPVIEDDDGDQVSSAQPTAAEPAGEIQTPPQSIVHSGAVEQEIAIGGEPQATYNTQTAVAEPPAASAQTPVAASEEAASLYAADALPIVPPAALPPSNDTTGATASHGQKFDMVALEELWSNVLDELQRRHLPTFSLVSTHGFPMSLENEMLTIGVKTESLQKILENKSEHIKNGCMSVLGRTVAIKVKVAGGEGARQQQGRAPRQKPTSPQDSDETEGAPQSAPRQSASSEAPPGNRAGFGNASANAASAAPGAMGSPQSPSAPPKLSPAAPPQRMPGASSEPAGSSDLLQEAAKIFDGPGARRIT